MNAVAQAMEAFLLDARARRLSPKTVRSYRDQVSPFVDFLAERGITTLADISPHDIRAYLVTLQERGLAENSIHTAATTLRVWFNWLRAEESLTVSPLAKIKMPKRSKATLPAFAPADIRALLAECNCERDRAIVLCLLDTGARSAEFVALNVGDVEPDGAVTIRKGKGGKARVTFLGAHAQRALRRWMQTRGETMPSDPLWTSHNTGGRLTPGGLQQVLERIGERAGVHAHPHKFRRSFALWALRSGMDVFALQRLMGHADLTVLRRYLDQNRADLQQAHALHGPVDSLLQKGRKR